MACTLFVGDVHGCADELDRLLSVVLPERVVLVGDLFTKGPDPDGVWSLIRQWGAEIVLGNHDDVVLERWRPGRRLPTAAFDWLREQPWLRRGPGWVVAHAGVNPLDWRETRRHQALHLERWDKDLWWKRYEGAELVIHGHHARHGLIDRRPFTLGLDTACVKGGCLTGYVLEDDELVSVPARRAWA